MKSEIIYLKPDGFKTSSNAVDASLPVQACVIGLHGLGASGSDFVGIPSLLLNLKKSLRQPVKFVFPNAPIRPITANQGYEMPAWYDVRSWSDLNREDLSELANSREMILDLIEQEMRNTGLPADKIILLGFSQGGALALSTALQETRGITVGGVIALSCYLPGKTTLQVTPERQTMPILMVHGIEDDIVPCDLGEETANYLLEQGLSVEWHRLANLTHQINSRVLKLMDSFLINHI